MREREKWHRKGTYVIANGKIGRIEYIRHHLFMDKKMVSYITVRYPDGSVGKISADAVSQAKQVFKTGL